MQERRRFVRAQTPVLVEFPNPETMETERSFTQDVSEAGMRFPSGATLRIGQELPMTLQLPASQATLRTMGEVIWLREIARHGTPQYEVGVRFRWIDDPDRQHLARHLGTVFPRSIV